MYIQHSIEIRLNSTGYQGHDVDLILPDFITDRQTTVGLTWYPSYNGPESFTIYMAIAAGIGMFCGKFVELLASDLYAWCKEKLLNLVAKKIHPDCSITIKLEDVEIYFHDEDLFDSDLAGDILLEFFKKIPELVLLVKHEESKLWQISYDRENSTWLVIPVNENI